MTVVETPALAGSRRRAQEILADLPAELSDVEVVLASRGVIAAAVSFVDEIVKEVLVHRHASMLRVTGATDQEFINYFRQRATAHGVLDHLRIDS